MFGKLYKGQRVGLWSQYYYDQKIKVWNTYQNNESIEEKYLNLDESLFSGVFTYKDNDKNIKEERKIKNGFRNGNTVYIDLNTDKVVNRIKYKEGVLK